ncbi:hypothetical protein BOX15_Mlig016487g2 [Macrostomum lignano]|uniref:Uncharacterized protein n=1 Tax=Macrostomum lignano TaxID=282301 RepID=A0A267GJ96_9PLAT|nr:hypothetical protein BOX15_Mlig016487g1 [Macrostomum lignano]PAA86131.1 hypothetical protein BOX15_Mlig016487g2 [Macrostomum lignano]
MFQMLACRLHLILIALACAALLVAAVPTAAKCIERWKLCSRSAECCTGYCGWYLAGSLETHCGPSDFMPPR